MINEALQYLQLGSIIVRDIVDSFEPYQRYELEDADFSTLKEAVSKVEKWKILDRGIMEFLEFFEKS